MKKLGITLALFLTLVGCSHKNNEEVKKYLPDEIKNVSIHSKGDNILIKETTTSEIKAKINKENVLKMKKNGNTLNISIKEDSFINLKTATLTLYIPRKTLDHISINSEAGKITGNISNAENVTINSGSSDISLNSFGGKSLRKSTIKTMSGSINIQLAESPNGYDIDANTASGKITKSLNMHETENSSKTLRGYTGTDSGNKSSIKVQSGSGKIKLTE